MASTSAVYKRFQSLPLPFGDDDSVPTPRGLSLPVFDHTPKKTAPSSHRRMFSPRVSSPSFKPFSLLEEDSVDSALGDNDSKSPAFMKHRTPSAHRRPLFSDSFGSDDEGFLDLQEDSNKMYDVPTSFDGLIKNLLLSSASAAGSDGLKVRPVTSVDVRKSHQRATKPSRKGLFKTPEPTEPSPLKKCLSFDVSSLGQKRSSICQDVEVVPAAVKRRRSSAEQDTPTQVAPQCSENDRIKSALDCDEEAELIGDFSKPYTLPTITGKHSDLQSISAETMHDLLDDKYADTVENITVIDCRYPYEFEGGHIKDALNIWERDTLCAKFFKSDAYRKAPESANKRNIVIFHCEFSSERGPKMSRFLRQMDRDSNKSAYPDLYYPELYLLDGGYKAFYLSSKNHCVPETYLPMSHQDYIKDLKHFRVKSKSWAGEKSGRKMNRRSFCQLTC